MTEPARYPEKRLRAAAVRSRLMLQVASVLVGDESWPDQQVRIEMRPPGGEQWRTALFASDGIEGVAAVLGGHSQFAILNPATAIRSALLRLPGARGDELAAVATVPSYDQLGLAVPAALGLHNLADLADARPALRVSLRGNRPTHSVHLVLDEVLAAGGISLDDIRAWGGEVRYDDGLPHKETRTELLLDGRIDAIFDEGVYNWVELANDAGLRFLALPDSAVETLTALGYRTGTLRRDRYRTLDADVPTIDFSGFLVFTRADADFSMVSKFCEALISARELTGWQGGPTLPLEQMCTDTIDAPLPIPFHPAAEGTWRGHGLL
ncbi:hypothetical protein BH10ACT9_BH10ACT9_42290 [soil metagenome]